MSPIMGDMLLRCFNPRAREGRDLAYVSARAKTAGFQSTRPRGARRTPDKDGAPGKDVSIHAPARGATRAWRTGRRGRAFQSTRPRGARRVVVPWYLICDHSFNPRAREGRDLEDARLWV